MRTALLMFAFAMMLPTLMDMYLHPWLTQTQVFVRHYLDMGIAVSLIFAAMVFCPPRSER